MRDAKHSYELPVSNKTVICADYLQRGVGSNACGPVLDEKYALPSKFTYKVTIQPISNKDNPAVKCYEKHKTAESKKF